MNKKISIIGLGYVGLPLALAFQKYYRVCGYDVNQSRIQELKKGFDSNCEFKSNKITNFKNIFFSNTISDISDSDFIIVTVPTPVNKKNQPDLKPLSIACKQISRYIKKKSIIIFESTVYPSCTENFCIPLLENGSGKKINKDFYVGYSPERINVGDNKHTLEKITKIISASSPGSKKKVKELYSRIIKAGVYVCPNIMTAEAAKAIENAQRDINIAFVNEISIIFNKLGLKSSEVLSAAKTKWNFLNFTPGLVGGHCIGVDPYYLTYIAKHMGVNPKVINAGRAVNDKMHYELGKIFLKKIKYNFQKLKKFNLLILGLSFKENTNDIRNSKVFNLCSYLKKLGHNVYVYDPLVKTKISNQNFVLKNRLDFRKKFHGIFLAVPHLKILKKIKLITQKTKKNAVLFDFKNLLSSAKMKKISKQLL
jgi:UDP-N-acetyl-D-glucosamine/UDP-N-acetyl-D-galactosamine dehydrogenase